MPVSEAIKDIIAGGIWARSPTANREDPEDLGLDRAEGWPLAYEQRGAGKTPERTIFIMNWRMSLRHLLLTLQSSVCWLGTKK